MANSDNVVRAGLTPKFKDVGTLLEMLSYRDQPASEQLLRPQQLLSVKHTLLFKSPVPDFSVLMHLVPADTAITVPANDNHSIILCVNGHGNFISQSNEGPQTQTASAGHAFYIPPGLELKMQSLGDFVCFRAFSGNFT